MIKNNVEMQNLEILEVEDMEELVKKDEIRVASFEYDDIDNATVQDIEEEINENSDSINEDNDYENLETQSLEKVEVEGAEEFNSETTEILKKEVDSESYEHQDIQVETVAETQITSIEKLDFSKIQNPVTKAHRAREINKVAVSLVNDKNGKWLKSAGDVLEKIGAKNSKYINVAFLPYGTVLSSDISGIGESFPLSKGGHIYSKGLVEEITERFKLDFTGVTTRSFSNAEYQELDNGYIVAIIKM